jgi:HAD superfamily hydrolase (TIGR01450 family)
LNRAPSAALLARLRGVQGFLFDLDGTLVLGDKHNTVFRPLPGALEFTQRLAEEKVPFVVLTNGTVRTPAQYAEKLRSLGFPIEDRMMVTPASVAADYLRRRGLRRVLVLGGDGIIQPLIDAGLEVVLPRQRQADVQAIMIGWFREFGIEDLEIACEAASRGARVFAASLAPFYATADGRALGTSRAIAAMISSLTGRRASAVGKPALFALRFAAAQIGVKPSALAVVGDDPELEVAMAHRGRALAIGVRSGVGQASVFAAMSGTARAHLLVQDVAELARLYFRGSSGAAARRIRTLSAGSS